MSKQPITINQIRCIILDKKLFTELRSITFHMGSHSVNCHPTLMNVSGLNPS